MNLIIAAGGRGSRLGQFKPLAFDPVHKKPMLHHVMTRIIDAFPQIDRVYISCSTDETEKRDLIDFLTTCTLPVQLNLVMGERKGVGYAFHLAMQAASNFSSADTILTVCDVLAQDYSGLARGGEKDILLGAIPHVDGAKKQRTVVSPDAQGFVKFGTFTSERYALAGIYKVPARAFISFADLLEAGIKGRLVDFNIQNARGEFRVTWAWRKMAQMRFLIRLANLGQIAELNEPEDFEDIGRLLSTANTNI